MCLDQYPYELEFFSRFLSVTVAKIQASEIGWPSIFANEGENLIKIQASVTPKQCHYMS